jgi:hypothetical protein
VNILLILTIGFTFFVGQPNWYELDTSGIDWTVYQIEEQVEEQIVL